MNKDNNKVINDKYSELDDNQLPPLTDEEIEIIRATKEGETDRSTLPPYDTSEVAQAKRYAKNHKLPVIFVAITIVMLSSLILFLALMLGHTIATAPSKDDYQVTIGNDELVLDYKAYTRNGVFYFDMRQIAPYAELVISGGDGRLKFTCPDGTYVRFEDESYTATVNGKRVDVGGKVEIIEKTDKTEAQCLVPFSFVKDLFSYPAEENTPGMRIKYSEKDNTVIIRRVTYGDSGEPLKITFSESCFDSAEDMQMKYDKNENPQMAFACVKRTELVNKNNPLGDSYVPEGLFSLEELGCPIVEGREFMLDENAAKALTRMLEDMHKDISDDEGVVVTSAYRSYEYQVELWNKYITNLMNKGYSHEQAIAELTKTSAYPGESEHQTGLCVDLIQKGKLNLDESFENTEAFEWLSENAYKYGFILRYPKGKEAITGYDYEPWHYRFVGIDAARTICEDKICLEEYLGKI